uniref:Putative secreted protein n=1 Tax=Anopheles darlingi TaxID=43151 RepID=A0A2M4DQV1_ANODA
MTVCRTGRAGLLTERKLVMRMLLIRARYAGVAGAQLPMVLMRCPQVRGGQLVERFALGRRRGCPCR